MSQDATSSVATVLTATLNVTPSQIKDLFTTCTACHGTLGEGNASLGAPALSNQDAWYLKRQLNNFRNGIRGTNEKNAKGIQMAAAVKIIKTDAELDELITHIKSLPNVTTTQTIEGDVLKGEQQYQMICGACHGPKAIGNQSLNAPKLAGINDWYLYEQYRNFSLEIRGSHPDDNYGYQMQMMSSALTEDQGIKDVIAYIRSVEITE